MAMRIEDRADTIALHKSRYDGFWTVFDVDSDEAGSGRPHDIVEALRDTPPPRHGRAADPEIEAPPARYIGLAGSVPPAGPEQAAVCSQLNGALTTSLRTPLGGAA